jgi:uncharacterized protein involved in response to NO
VSATDEGFGSDTPLHIEEPARQRMAGALVAPAAPEGLPLLRLGFRPFYLLAALTAAVLPQLWLALLTGGVAIEPALPPALWHGHEMVFGVVVAVIVGFLFTAGRTWTGLPTPTGPFLAALALLWLAARVTALTGPSVLFMALDLAFLPLVTAVFLDLVLRANNLRNLPMAVLVALLATANVAFHAAQAGLLQVAPGRTLQAAVLLIVAVMSIVAGRVIPGFIGNAVPGSRPRTDARTERAVLPLTGLTLLAWCIAPQGRWTALAFFALALLHVRRMWRWQPWVARGRPILRILPAAYAWIPFGLGWLGAASLGLANVSIGVHALTAGAMGGLVVGMMSRTSRGHTGRPLQAGLGERWAYGLVLAGGGLRVAAPLLPVGAYQPALLAGALAWSAAFALLFVTLLPWLTMPRVDGRAG